MGIKYLVNEKFFDSWSNDMAYVLGYWYADGSVERVPAIRGHYIRISSVDLTLIEQVKVAMKSKHNIVEYPPRVKGRMRYVLRIGSKPLFDAMNKHGLTEHKSLSMKFPKIPKKYLPAFIRGYFDGDGCIHAEKNVTGKTKRLVVIFTSGSWDFLLSLQSLLHDVAGVSSNRKIGVTESIGTAYQLRYGTRDSLRLFLFMYPKMSGRYLHLSRKYDIFVQYLQLRGLTDKNLPDALRAQGPMVKW